MLPVHSLGAALLLGVSLFAQDSAPKAPDYGPFRSGTVGARWNPGDIVPKSLIVPLDDRAAVVFDTDLCRMAFAWIGAAEGQWMQWRGPAYDGAHGTHLQIAGRQIAANLPLPGYAKPGAEELDPRPIPCGPLPKGEGRWLGLHRHGRQVALSYELQGRRVLESYALLPEPEGAGILRTLELGAGKRPLWLRVLGRKGGKAIVSEDGRLGRVEYEVPQGERVTITKSHVASGARWSDLPWLPSKADYASPASGHGVTARWLEGYSQPHPRSGAGEDRSLPRLLDGELPRNRDDTGRNVWFDGGEARLLLDLQELVTVHGVHSFSWHTSDRAPQRYVLYGSKSEEPIAAEAKQLDPEQWQRIASVDTRPLGPGGRHAAFVRNKEGSLGAFRHLLFVCAMPGSQGTFFSEIDVWAGDQRAEAGTVAPVGKSQSVVALHGDAGVRLHARGEEIYAELPASDVPLLIGLQHAHGKSAESILSGAADALELQSPRKLQEPGPALWGEPLETKGSRAEDDAAFVVDTLTHPAKNPWGSDMRFGAFDFFEDGRLAVSTWNGDVWIVSGIDDKLEKLQWKRFATGLYDPLGLKIVNGIIHTHGRDQITQLRDHDGDGEADEYRCFWNGSFTTKNFHEFAFGLQTDAKGNFYVTKGGPVRPGGRGFEDITPHHGTLLRISPDGEKVDVMATGLRAPNGLGVRSDGLLSTGDNEGTWMPKCRLNLFRNGYFAGCMDTAHRDPAPELYDLPVCWMPMNVDNSSGAQIWVEEPRFGAFEGRMLHLSYGQCRLYLVCLQKLGAERWQGGVTPFPLSFASSLMRARFGPKDGALYVSGLKGWQTRAARRTALQRVRRTELPIRMLESVESYAGELRLRFTCPLDEELVSELESWSLSMWNYEWTESYGSPHVSVLDPSKKGRDLADKLEIASASLGEDERTVVLEVPGLVPAMQLRLSWMLEDIGGEAVESEVHFTIHELPKAR